jgi:intracellular septation protein
MRSPDKSEALPPLVKMALELGPLLIFFVAFQMYKNEPGIVGLMVATGVFMVALLVSNAITYWLTKTISKMTLATTVIVMVMGGLTLALQDETFIKMKPTIVNACLGGLLLIGLLQKQSFLKLVMGEWLPLTNVGWMKLTRNWIIYFFCMAAFNEVVWRSVETETWVWMKTFVYLPITFAFTMSQMPLMSKHAVSEKKNGHT